MPRVVWLIPVLLLSLGIGPPVKAHAQGVAQEARTWFLTEYVPLWRDLDSLDPARVTAFWTDRFLDHPIDMDPSIWENTREQWQRNIDRNKAEGLVGSTVVGIQVEEISSKAVLIRTTWSDYGPDGPIEALYCGTFIAGRFGQEWKFTNYFTVDCS